MKTPDVRSHALTCRYYLTYRGFDLPLALVEPLDAACLTHRNTYVRAYFDEQELLRICEKVVYGEVEVRHVYDYHASGKLRRALITVDDEVNTLSFDEDGVRV